MNLPEVMVAQFMAMEASCSGERGVATWDCTLEVSLRVRFPNPPIVLPFRRWQAFNLVMATESIPTFTKKFVRRVSYFTMKPKPTLCALPWAQGALFRLTARISRRAGEGSMSCVFVT